jgi:peptide/nickel transport system substrate-binding protein
MNRKLPFALLSAVFFVSLCIGCTSCKNEKKGKGNTVTIRLAGEPERLNPMTTEEGNATQVMSHIFMPLLDFDPKTLELTPVLAKNRPLVVNIDTGAFKGNLGYVYEIRDEATWDNGKPVNASDYIFTIKTILNRKVSATDFRGTIDFISDIIPDAQNPKKFTIVANKRYILSEASSGNILVLPEYVYDTEGVLKNVSIADLAKTVKDTTSKPFDAALTKFATAFQTPKFQREKGSVVGCGAYSLESWTAGQSIVLNKKVNWWGDKLASQNLLFSALPEQLVFKPVKDNATVSSLIQNGELDAVQSIGAKDFIAMKKDEKLAVSYSFEAVPALSVVYIGLNCKDPKLNDKRVRKALSNLIDIPTAIKTLVGGYGESCNSPFIPQRDYYNKDIKGATLNPEKAKQMLTDAGWTDTNGDSTIDKSIDGTRKEMTLRYIFASANEPAKNLGLILQDQAKKIGVKIELVSLEGKTMLESMKKRDFDMFISAANYTPSLDDPKQFWASSSNTPDGGNRFQFENSEADALIEQIRGELNPDKRRALYLQFQALLDAEQPAIFLLARQERIAVNKRFDAPLVARRPGYLVNGFKIK